MTIQVNMPPLLQPPAPWFCTMVLLICSLLSSSHARSCFCSGPHEQWNSITMSSSFEQMGGDLFLTKSGTYLPGSLGSYMKSSSSAFNLSDTGLFIIPDYVVLWEKSQDGMDLREASFNVTFTMAVYQTQGNNSSRLVAAILPRISYSEGGSMVIPLNGSGLAPTNSTTKTIGSSLISVKLDTTSNRSGLSHHGIIWVEITIEKLVSNSTTSNYSVWIDYSSDKHHMSVYVDSDTGKPKPTSAITELSLNMSDTTGQVGFFSLSSSMWQLLRLQIWSLTVRKPLLLGPFPCTPNASSPTSGSAVIIIWPSVLGSAAATTIMATAVYCYFNSKYRRWKKDLDKLAKSMQRLPGVPTKVAFRDIKRATKNFHEATRLGRGGFGAVYQCSLPNPQNGEALEAAVKKFTRHDNGHYEDFLAEVSIINSLRHKNIVPLIGWSYSKGQALLIYEYMPNGSLDQHLFRRGGDQQQRPPTPMHQWGTRYNIVKDIASGLQYVHHEYEQMVLHRDIKASNIMIDSTFHGRLGDFGLACVVADGRTSYTDVCGIPGTIGFMAPEYIQSGKATRKTDIFAFGVLVLEIVTGKTAVGRNVQFGHFTDWVWHLHHEGNLLDAVDPVLKTDRFDPGDAKRLLLLGLACSSPNPSDRPSMAEVIQVITKSTQPPEVPYEKPKFVWPLEEEECPPLSSDYTAAMSNLDRGPTVMVEMSWAGGRHAPSSSGDNKEGTGLQHHAVEVPDTYQECSSVYHTAQ